MRAPGHRRALGRRAVALTAAAALLAACGGDGGSAEPEATATDDQAGASSDELAVVVASYDVAVGEDRRLIAGVLTPDREQIAFGEVEFQLGYLGEEPATGEVDVEQTATASYLPVPGLAPEVEPTAQPTVLAGEPGTGVYEAQVDLDQAGFYLLRVVAELEDGTSRVGQTPFQVLAETEVPDVGDEAPLVDNLTIADVEAGDAPPVAVDSRAQGEDAEVPDPHLHDTTVAEAVEAGTPVVAILSTPTYCVSTFCGPLTEELATVAQEHEDVEFIHLEVWRDFEAQELNEAAAAWIQTETGGNEPWVFLVDGEGTVRARWDNVLDVDELEQQLQAL